MANIILEKCFSIRTTQFNSNEEYSLTDLSFYIRNDFTNYEVYLSIFDDKNMSEVIPLNFVENYGNYKIYKVDTGKKLRIKSGNVKIKILLIDDDFTIYSSINNLPINIVVDDYNLSHQLYVCRELNSGLCDIYNKVIELSNLNLDIYNDILEIYNSNQTEGG